MGFGVCKQAIVCSLFARTATKNKLSSGRAVGELNHKLVVHFITIVHEIAVEEYNYPLSTNGQKNILLKVGEVYHRKKSAKLYLILNSRAFYWHYR